MPDYSRCEWVYLAEDDGEVKVGIAIRPERRIKEQEWDHPWIRLVQKWHVPRDAHKVEWLAHWMLREHRIKWEWFAASEAQAREAVEDSIRCVATRSYPKIPRGRMPKWLKEIIPPQDILSLIKWNRERGIPMWT